MTGKSHFFDNACVTGATPRVRQGPRARRAAVMMEVAPALRARRLSSATRETSPCEPPSQRLRRILTAHPRARHFSIRRIVCALGESSQGPTAALFSAAGAFEAPHLASLSSVVTGAVGARMAVRREGVWLPRVVLRRRIPRASLAKVIGAVSNVLELAEDHARPRWGWVFHPAMKVVLGVLLFLLALASAAPILGVGVHIGPAFIMSVGLAERDGVAVMIGALAGVASLVVAATTLVPGKRLLETKRNWLCACFRRLGLRSAAWLLDKLDEGIGALLRVRWSSLLFLFAADVMNKVDQEVLERKTLRRRIDRIRAAQRLRATQPIRI